MQGKRAKLLLKPHKQIACSDGGCEHDGDDDTDGYDEDEETTVNADLDEAHARMCPNM